MAKYTLVEARRNFLKMYCEGNKLLCAHRRANTFERYLEVADYEDSGRQGMLVIPEGTEGEGSEKSCLGTEACYTHAYSNTQGFRESSNSG